MRSGQSIKGQLIFLAVLAALFLVGDLVVAVVSFYTDWLWFTSVGYENVFITVFQAKVLAFVVGSLAFLVPAALSLLAVHMVMRRQRTVSIREEKGIAYIVQLGQDVPRRLVTLVALLASAGLAVISGISATGQWETGLRFLNAKAFGVTDPLFGQDVGFYFFSLPLYQFIQGWLFWTLLAILALSALVYLVSVAEGNITLDPGVFVAHRAAKVHVMVLAALTALAVAFSYRLQIFDLVFAARAVTSGAGYTDATARQTALWVLMGVTLVIAVLFLVSAFRRGFTLPLYGVGLWFLATIVLGVAYPSVVQNLQVAPNELQMERPYIDSSIKMTRQAFGLNNIQEQNFQAADTVTAAEVNATPDTIDNIRLWDHRLLLQTYNQIQSIRLYYDFNNIGIDRYTIGGQYRQVMLAARELDPSKLAAQAQNWVTRHLQFTHGYGLAMSPVNEIVGEGLPNLLVKDIPPTGDMKIDKPQIYYGLTDPGYAIVKTTAQEFDYPKGEDNVYGSYQGEGGVKVDSLLRRLAYAWYFKDGNILFSSYFTPDSRVLYVRNIQDRIAKVAPFLMLDRDPYLVVADGQLFWIQDAYTTSTDYPYSAVYQEQATATIQTAQGQQIRQVQTGRAFNYIRNSVKVVVSAYDGSMRFYLADPSDPLVSSYASIFPGLFVPMDQMPASIRAHVRYPEDLFRAQANMYSTFHMQDPQVFYNREDQWNVSTELAGSTKQPIDPYYVIMKLPGQPKEEFLEMLPYSPSNKDNMIAWLAARSDGANYGKLVVYMYPKDKLSYGPSQIEARVNQDPTISAQFTLWSQSGSSVTKGNLLVIPVGQANLYVMPIYLQASSGSIPELKRVILSTGNKVVMEATLGDALGKLFDGKVTVGGAQPAPAAQPAAQPAPQTGQQPPSTAQPSATPAPGAPASVADLIKSAQDHYNAAQDKLKAGDWAGYGDEMKKLQQDLNALNAQTR